MPATGELAENILFVAGVGPQMDSATAKIAAREGAKVHLDGGVFAGASWPTDAAPCGPPPARPEQT